MPLQSGHFWVLRYLASSLRLGVAVAALEVGEDALEGVAADGDVAAVVHVAEVDGGVATAVQDHLSISFAQFFPRLVQVEVVVLREGIQHVVVIDVAAVPAADGALGDTALRIEDHLVFIEELLHAQAVAGGAGTGGVVEREQARFQFIQ